MKTWKLTTFDLFSLGMTIKGAWIYQELPSPQKLQASLEAVLQPYPQLLGRYDERQKAVLWSGQEKPIRLVDLDRRGHSASEDMYTLVPRFGTNRFKSGKARALEAYRITLDDGAAVVLQGSHALMDGYTFYRIAGDWARAATGSPIAPLTVDQALIPAPGTLTREQTLERVQELGWCRLGLGSLVGMLARSVTTRLSQEPFVLEVGREELARLRAESGAGTNAVLCLYAVRRLLEHLPAKASYTLLEVADLRGRACGVPEGFFGNFSQALVIGTFGRDAAAAEIQTAASAILHNREALSENVQLSVSTSHYGLPCFPFDPCRIDCRNPQLFYVNNQLRCRAAEVDFGTGLPLRVQQAMLPDMIKLWQSEPDGPVQIIYSGHAARAMRRKPI